MGRTTARTAGRMRTLCASSALMLAAIGAPRQAVAQAEAAGAAVRPAPGAAGAPAPEAEVVVTGQRLSDLRALDAKRDAVAVTDVISADDLGKLPDATVADSLARIPGVGTIVNQDTGEGQYVTIRGLSGTYNAVMINGVRVANTDPSSRDVSLNLLPPYGLASATVAKTLTPDQDGDAIGGTIDFRTPTAFDFKDPQTLRLYASGGFNDRAQSANLPSEAYQVQGDLAKRFGGDRFGVFLSGNYSVSHGDGQETENDGEWEPYNFRLNSTEAISQRDMQLPGIDLDFRRVKQTRYGGNASFDYREGATRLFLRGQIARQELRGSNDTTDYEDRRTPRLTQVNVDDTSLVQPQDAVVGTGAKGRIYSYTPRQIVDVDGDGVITDADRNSKQYWSLNGRSGVWSPQAFEFGRNFSVIDQNQTLGTVDLGGETRLGRLHLDGDVSYSGGLSESPDNYSISYTCDACTYPLNATGIQWTSQDPRFPHAGIPAYAAFVEHDPSLLPFNGASHDRSKQTDSRYDARAHATYDFGDGWLHAVTVGGRFADSHRVYDYTPIWSGDFTGTALDGKNLQQSGLILREVNSLLHGEYYYGAIYDRGRVVQAITAAQAADPAGLPSASDLVAQDTASTERIYAAFAMADLRWRIVQVVAGVRGERRETHARFYSDDGATSGTATTNAGYDEILPSLTAIVRPDGRQVYRAAVWTGYAPPEYGYISGGQSVTRDPGTNEITAISRGNPDLKAAYSTNFDLSAEYYPDHISVVSLAAYYKKIRDFIFTNGSQVDADTQQGTVDITQPQNGRDAEVYGVEGGIIKDLRGLPAPFDGFGVQANFTLQHSRGDPGVAYRAGRTIPLINTPSQLYNAALTYQKYGFEAKLAYNYRGKYIESLRDNAVDKWVQHNDSLDLHTRYYFNARIALDFDVSNLTDTWKYYTTKGESPSYQKDYMEPGRNYVLRTSFVF